MSTEIDKRDLALRDAFIDGGVQFIPVVSAIYSGAKTYLERIEEAKQNEFFEELNIQPTISKDKLYSNSFARRVLITTKAASNTESTDKIRMLARLLRTSESVEEALTFDDYKYYVELIDELSPRELLILSIIDKYRGSIKGGAFGVEINDTDLDELALSKKAGGRGGVVTLGVVSSSEKTGFQFTITKEALAWLRAKREILQNLNITEENLNPLIDRLLRTGLIRKSLMEHTNGTRLYGQEQVELTYLFDSLKVYVQKESGEII